MSFVTTAGRKDSENKYSVNSYIEIHNFCFQAFNRRCCCNETPRTGQNHFSPTNPGNQRSCLQENFVKRMLFETSACIVTSSCWSHRIASSFAGVLHESFFCKQLCWFLKCSAGKNTKISFSLWWRFLTATSAVEKASCKSHLPPQMAPSNLGKSCEPGVTSFPIGASNSRMKAKKCTSGVWLPVVLVHQKEIQMRRFSKFNNSNGRFIWWWLMLDILIP